MQTSTFIYRQEDLRDAKAQVEDLLGVNLTFHDSDFRGGTYCRGKSADYPEIIIQLNYDDEDDEPLISGESGDFYVVKIHHSSATLRSLMEKGGLVWIRDDV